MAIRKIFVCTGLGGRGKTFTAALLADIAISTGIKHVTLIDAYDDISNIYESFQNDHQTVDVLKYKVVGGPSYYKNSMYNLLSYMLDNTEVPDEHEDHVVIIDFAEDSTTSLTPDILKKMSGSAEVVGMELHVMFAFGHTYYDTNNCSLMLKGSPNLRITVVVNGRPDFNPTKEDIHTIRDSLGVPHDMVAMPLVDKHVAQSFKQYSLRQLASLDTKDRRVLMIKHSAEKAFEECKPILAKYLR